MTTEKIMAVMDEHRWKSMGVSSVQCECGQVCYGDESLTQFPADEAFRRHVAAEVMRAIADPYDNHDRRILMDAYTNLIRKEVVVVECPHRVGLTYRGAPADGMSEDWLMRLPCPCNDKSQVIGTVTLERNSWDDITKGESGS